MSSLNYKNPLTPIKAVGATSLDRTKTNGVTFSILNTGGFVEVYNITDLIYTIPENQTGNIEYSGNVIPIQFTKSDGNPFSFDVITLNSDNISSGRRRLGMLAYVYETNQTYQFIIDNYDVLWSAATGSTGVGGNTVVISEFGTTVKNNTEAGQNFINAWTASTIENISGGTSNSAWRIYNTSTSGNTDVFVTGGTYSAGTATFINNTGGTFNVTGFSTSTATNFTGGTVTGATNFTDGLTANTISATTYFNLPTDVFVTGGTYSAGTVTFTNNTGGTFNVTGFSTSTATNFTGGTVTGATNFTDGLTANTISATTYFNLPTDVFVTGGTYDSNSGISTFTNNTGGTFNVSGYFTPSNDIFTTGLTFNSSTYDLNIVRNDGNTFSTNLAILASDMTITGGTYNPNTGVATFTNNTGGTFSVSGFLTGQTDTYVTGLTFTNNVLTLKQTNNQADINVLINNLSGLTIDGSLSATTYLGLPLDINVTGGTYSDGIATFINNTGGTFNVTGFSTSTATNFTGGTVTGATNFTDGLTANTISATTYVNLPTDVFVTGGTYSNNTFTYTNNTGGTFNVLFNTVTGLTVNGNLTVSGTTSSGTISATTYQNLPISGLTAGQNISITGSNGNFTITFTGGTSGSFTGGTVTGATNFTDGLTANTISATTYVNLPTDVFVTGGTYSSGTTTLTLVNSTGGTVLVTGFTSGNGGGGTFTGNTSATCINDIWVSNIHSCSPLFINPNNEGVVYFGSTSAVTIDTQNGRVGIGTNSPGVSLNVNSNAARFGEENIGYIIISDGFFDDELGIITGNDESIATYQYGGIYGYGGPIGNEAIRVENKSSVRFGDGNIGYVYISDDNYGGELGIITNNDESIAITDFDGNFRYGGPIGSESIVVEPNSNTSIEGRLIVVNKSGPGNGVVGIDKSKPATTLDVGGTGRFTGGLTADTISATTYFNLPTDVFVTGITFTNNSLLMVNNTGGTLNTTINTFTGLSISNNLTVSGQTNLLSLTGTTDRMLQISSGGTVTATTEIIEGFLESGTTATNLLDDPTNWDGNGVYTGSTITGTYQGQLHYNSSYLFMAVDDNLFIRLGRV